MNYKSIKDKISRRLGKENLKLFFQKQGLYVLIFLCVVAAGITAIIAWPRDEDNQISEQEQGAAIIEAPSLSDEIAAQKTPVATTSAVPSPGASVSPTPSGGANPPGGSGKMTLTKPVKGQVITNFSGNNLIYYPSLNIWATHNGVDLKAENGTSVGAALSGTVMEVSNDESDGGVVVISHSGNSMTLYAGLGNIVVEKDEKISAGQKIGEVGEMPKELDLSYHLHFEYIVDPVYKNGVLSEGWKDPEKYFK